MRLDVLGRLRLRDGSGAEVRIPRGKAGSLLFVLAAHHGRTVPLTRLVEALWGEDPPRTSTASLHNHVSSLRSVLLRAAPHGDERLRFVAGGYQLDLEWDECDLIEFEHLSAEGHALAQRGEHVSAATMLRQAIGLWRGSPSWHGASSGATPLIDDLVGILEHARIAAQEDCLTAEIERGRHADVILELRGLIADQPLHERWYVLLMRALWLDGQRTEALEVYRSARRTLTEALGVEPGAELAELQTRILRDERASGSAPVLVPRQLPADTADFTGREETVEWIVELLSGTDPVTTVAVSGQPGTGKTALAVRTAHALAAAFPDGQLYASLGGGSGHARPAEDVLGDLLRSLGVPDQAVPMGVEQRAAMFRSRLAEQRMLVVLDDAEDVAQVRPVLPGVPGSAVLVTSRRLMVGLPNAMSVQLGPLAPAEGLRMLVKTLGTQRIEGEPEAAAELVELCGRLPLALRVVVARLATRPRWSLGSLLRRMRAQRNLLDELAVAELDVRAVFTVSHNLLGELEQVMFRRFALVDAAALPPWALAALTDGNGLDEALHQLLTNHLVEPAAGPAERYTMHDLVRAFAAERLADEEGDAEQPGTAAHEVFRRLLDMTRSLIEVAYARLPTPAGWLTPTGPGSGVVPPPVFHGPVARDPMRWCAEEIDVLVAVLTKAARLGWHREALDAVERLNGFLAMKHRMGEVERLYTAIAEASATDDRARARAMFGLAHACAMGGRLPAASTWLIKCATLFAEVGTPSELMNTLVLLSFCQTQLGDLAEAEETAREAMRIGRAGEDRSGYVRSLRQLGAVLINRGNSDDAVEPLGQALELAEAVGEADLEALVLSSLSKALVDLGELDHADELCRRAIKLLNELDQPVGRAHVLVSQSRILELRVQHLDAVVLLEDCLRVFREFGDRRGEVRALYWISVNRLALGDAAAAIPLLRSALSICQEVGLQDTARDIAAVLSRAQDT